MSLLSPRIQGDSVAFDRAECAALGAAHREAYLGAQPFRHVVLDDFLPLEMLRRVDAEFPERRAGRFSDRQSTLKTGYQLDMIESPFITNLFYALNSAQFLAFLEELTGIEGLISDPYYSGGGLHETARGGHLSVHADYNLHHSLGLWRRLNLIVFLNEDWQPEFLGDLELWGRDMKSCAHKVAPVMGRAVVFNTTETSWHGHPDPLACPESRYRRSLALYYFTVPEPGGMRQHTTVFKARPGSHDRPNLRDVATDWARDLCPPILWRAFSRRQRP